MAFLLTLLTFLFIISFLIVCHEFGHFIVAKKAGLKVEEFSLGFPPRIFSKKSGETVYSLNLIPFGGFVKIYGEDNNFEDKRSFSAQKPLTKAKILLAGVLMNIIVAILIFYLVLSLSGFKLDISFPFDYQFPFGQQRNFPLIVALMEDSPAERSGLQAGDIVILADEQNLKNSEEFSEIISREQREISLLVENTTNKEQREIKVLPEQDPETKNFFIGVALSDLARVSYERPLEKVFSGFLHTANMTHLSFYTLARIARESLLEKTVEPIKGSFSGVVGIFAITHLVLEEGIIEVFNLIALISIALAVINVLPIPALDGGRLVFVLYEAVFRKQAPAAFEKKLNFIGLIFLLLLVLFVTYNDIIRFGGMIKEMF